VRSIAEALAELLPAFTPRGAVRRTLIDALDAISAEDVPARIDLPPFDNSAMDGYAVRARDLQSASAEAPVSLRVTGESRAGGTAAPSVAEGSAVRIFTGAPVPSGADAIVMQEDTERDGDTVRVRVAAQPGAHVRARASDLAAGTPLLRRATRLGPGEIGLLASQGYSAVSVHRAPTVAIVSTGDELRDVSDPPSPGTIVNSNAYALAAQVLDAGGVPWILPNAPDRLDAIARTLREALAADIVVTCGGVSVGEYDLVHDALREVGVEQAFWKVAMKPGKPLSFGIAGAVPVVGLPGNPVSAMVTFELFVRPGIRRMLGDPAPYRSSARVELADSHRRSAGRIELARATLERSGDRLIARMHRLQGSGSLPSMVDVDALLILPADQERFEAGERLSALLLRDRAGTAVCPF